MAHKRSREELPHVQDQGQKPGGPHAQGAAAKRSYSPPEARSGGQEELPHARGRGDGREEQPSVQGAVATRAPEGLEELFHVQGLEGRWWGNTPSPSKEQWLHFTGVAVKRYPTSKVRDPK